MTYARLRDIIGMMNGAQLNAPVKVIVAGKEIVIDRVDTEDNDANAPYLNSNKEV
jgi:hypothetical protein